MPELKRSCPCLCEGQDSTTWGWVAVCVTFLTFYAHTNIVMGFPILYVALVEAFQETTARVGLVGSLHFSCNLALGRCSLGVNIEIVQTIINVTREDPQGDPGVSPRLPFLLPILKKLKHFSKGRKFGRFTR